MGLRRLRAFLRRHQKIALDTSASRAATAVQSQATGFVTNDSAFKRVELFETVVLEDLV